MMARITILGSGVVGLAIAAHLSRSHQVKVIAKNLPGDAPSIEWASPWAGANFVAGFCQSPRERMMQRDNFAELWRIAMRFPESSVKTILHEEYYDDDRTDDDFWYRDFVPDFHFIPKEELPKTVKGGVRYTSIVLDPSIFLPWMRHNLEESGVTFSRMDLKSLSDAKHLGHDVLINASGLGPRDLEDVRDQKMTFFKGQIMIVKTDYKKSFMRDDKKTYTYVIPRLDGTAILGGIRDPDVSNTTVDEEVNQDIVRRVNKNLPQHFSADLSNYDIVGCNVGIRPYRADEMRICKEIINGQNIVHAYGVTGGGYIFGFGVAREVTKLVEQYSFPRRLPKL